MALIASFAASRTAACTLSPLVGCGGPACACNARIRPEIFAISRANRRSLDPSQHLAMSFSAFFFTYALLCSARVVKCSHASRNESPSSVLVSSTSVCVAYTARRRSTSRQSVARLCLRATRRLDARWTRVSRRRRTRRRLIRLRRVNSHLASQSRVVAHLASDVRRPRALGRTARPCARVARDAR